MNKMGAPTISIAFTQAARTVAGLSAKGTVAVLVRDTNGLGAHELTAASKIPDGLSAANQAYVSSAFYGGVDKPKKVLLYVLDNTEGGGAELAPGLAWLSTRVFDWLAAPPDVTPAECETIKTWLRGRRDAHAVCKAVLPHFAAEYYPIVNFCGDALREGDTTYTAAQYCARIAGLLAGTPYTQSATYTALPELSDCGRISSDAEDEAVDAGQLVVIHDGVRVKLSRAVTSLTAASGVDDEHSEDWRKIKLVDLRDRVEFELRRAVADKYIGKFPNTYDNQCVLVTAIGNYFQQLEADGLVMPGWTVELDVEAKRDWLDAQGVDASALSDDEVKQYRSGTFVFIRITCLLVDAIEDVVIQLSH